MAASCVNVLKCSLFCRTFASARLFSKSGASVISFFQQHYPHSTIYNSSSSSSHDNSPSDQHDCHHPQFTYDSKTDQLDVVNDEMVERGIGHSPDEQFKKYLLEPDQPVNSKILRFSIIGVPNSGKSTLTNQLMNWKVSPVSSKVHTTRKNTVAVMTEERTQIVFVDTPGVVTSLSRLKHNLDTEMVSAPSTSLQVADMIGIIVDTSNHWTCKELGANILQLLHLNSDIPSILILNKVDRIKEKKTLLEMVRVLTEDHTGGVKTHVYTKKNKKNMRKSLFTKHNLKVPITEPSVPQARTIPVMSCADAVQELPKESDNRMVETKSDQIETWQDYHTRMQALRQSLKGKKGWCKFEKVFMISALTGDGVSQLRDYLLSQAVPGNWEFHSSLVTDQDPLVLARDLLWEKLLEILPEEVPYKIQIKTQMWEVTDDQLLIILNVLCKKKKHLHMIIGTRGSNIRNASEAARQAMMDAFRIDVRLKIEVTLETST